MRPEWHGNEHQVREPVGDIVGQSQARPATRLYVAEAPLTTAVVDVDGNRIEHRILEGNTDRR
jgi:hypothetical protein